ncbi:MAG: zinc ribbon domain-containing protein [Oscillospiraceae bacterium]|nr:zinc ribbon domain-containing protein [Oscillospiraceae bacterium]
MSNNKNTAPPGSMQAVIGSAMGVIFIIFWTYTAVSAGAPFIFPLFGAFGLYTTGSAFIKSVKEYRIRKQQEMFYSGDLYTETDYGRRADPWEKGYSSRQEEPVFSGQLGDIYQYTDSEGNIYCPYCGVKVAHDFEYCPKCGKKLPFEINY